MKNPCKPCRFKTYRDSCVYSSSTCNQYSIELDIQVTKNHATLYLKLYVVRFSEFMFCISQNTPLFSINVSFSLFHLFLICMKIQVRSIWIRILPTIVGSVIYWELYWMVSLGFRTIVLSINVHRMIVPYH